MYNPSFYRRYAYRSEASADLVLGRLFELGKPISVVDLGCGIGTWVSACVRLGIQDVMGVDGAWVQVENLTIEQRKFKPVDLTQPVQVDRKFDLAISVEVAEHLTSDSAPVLIQSACRLADVVLFSAAIPLQGGTNHINEQWPEYWAAHFSANDYLCYDYLRPLLWSEDGIEYYYRQNLLLFIREGTTSDYAQALLKTVSPYRTAKPMPLVHPVKYMELATFANVDNRMLLKKLPSIIYDVTRRRLKALVSRRTQ